jgi:hypothetical protein
MTEYELGKDEMAMASIGFSVLFALAVVNLFERFRKN